MPQTVPGIDSDSVKMLEQARKGKARKFAMIAKGAEIQGLSIFRKGGDKAKLQELKKQGHTGGKKCWGVVQGEGKEMTFFLSLADFEKAPVKKLVLKNFLSEQADLTVKADFKLVAELPAVAETDEEQQDDATDDSTDVSADAASTDTTGETDEAAASAFQDRLTALAPDLKKALATNSPVTDDLKKFFAAAQQLAKKQQFDDGMRVLDKLEQLIQQALTEPEPKPAAQEEPPPEPSKSEPEAAAAPEPEVASPPPPKPKAEKPKAAKPSEDDAQDKTAERDARQKVITDTYGDLPEPLKFTTLDDAASRCAKITPDNRDTIEALEAYKDLMSECVQWTRSEEAQEHKDHKATVQAMGEAAKAELEAVKAAIVAAAALKAKLKEDFKQRLVELMPSIKTAQAPGSPIATEVATLLKQAQTQAKDKDFEAANATLDDLETTLERLTALLGLDIDFQTLIKNWGQVSSQSTEGMQALAAHLKTYEHEAADALSATITAVAEAFPTDLHDHLSALQQASAQRDVENYGKVKTACIESADASRAYLDKHAQEIEGCEQNPFGQTVVIREPVESVLQALQSSLSP